MPDSKAVLHMFCGKIASGKSTLAREMANSSNAVLICEDSWLATLYPGEIASLDDYVRATTRLRTALAPLVEALLGRGLDVVLDFQANTPAGRSWMRKLFEAAGADHRLHHLRASDDCCVRRLRDRNASGRHEYQVNEEAFALFNSHIVEPAPDEGFNLVVHDQH